VGAHAPREGGGERESSAKAHRWLLAAFFAGWVFMYADRAVLSPVIGPVAREFGASLSQIGLLSSGFFLAYAVLQIPFGFIANVVGRKRLLVVGFFAFGLTTALSGLTNGFLVLLVLSVATGVGQATYYPTQFSIAAEAIPPRGRAFGLAIVNNGMAVGVAGGTVLASVLAFELHLGWRTAFVAMGLLTMVAAVAMAIVVFEPRTARRQADASIRLSLLNRPQVAAYLAGFCSLYGFFVILVWLPFYLSEARGLGDLGGGFVSVLATIPAIPVALLAARFSDRWNSRRRLLLVLFPVAAISLVAIPLAPSLPFLMGALVLYAVSGKLVADPLIAAYLADVTDPRGYSAGYGLLNFAGMASSVVAPALTGLLAEATGTLDLAFYLAAGLLIVGVATLAFVGRDEVKSRHTMVEDRDGSMT
jgi:MFS family permease